MLLIKLRIYNAPAELGSKFTFYRLWAALILAWGIIMYGRRDICIDPVKNHRRVDSNESQTRERIKLQNEP